MNIQETSIPSRALQPLAFLDVYLNCVRGSQINWPAYIPRIQPYTNAIVARTTQLWLWGLVNTCRISSFTSLAVDVQCISQIRRVLSFEHPLVWLPLQNVIAVSVHNRLHQHSSFCGSGRCLRLSWCFPPVSIWEWSHWDCFLSCVLRQWSILPESSLAGSSVAEPD